MELYKQSCQGCGGDLEKIDTHSCKCIYCGNIYKIESVERYVDSLKSLLDESKIEAISNARRNLYQAVNAEYVSSQNVHECCVILKQLLPDDKQAEFFEIAVTDNARKVAKFIRKINIADSEGFIESAVRLLIRSLQCEYILETSDLIDRAYKTTDLVKYEKYMTDLSVEAEKVENCIYLTTLPRDVFVAYSSKDLDKVFDLVECLEEQGLSCFVAARNLRHGRGAVESYETALKEAMDNCQSFVFVSSTNSRHPGCDALRKEIPYIKSVDISNAPPELRFDYSKIPSKYKKHRVEYRIEDSNRIVAADRITSEFFDGYERVYSPNEVAERVINASMMYCIPAEEKADDKKTSGVTTALPVKYCVNCEHKIDSLSKFCNYCGSSEFADSLVEVKLMRRIRELEEASEASKSEDKTRNINADKPFVSTQKPRVEIQGVDSKIREQEKSNDASKLEDKTRIVGAAKAPISAPTPHIDVQRANPKNSKAIPIRSNGVVTCAHKVSVDDPSRIVQLTIPKGTESIKYGAFAGCTNLTSVEIPEGVKTIESAAFRDCVNLKSIRIPKSVSTIGYRAFLGCKKLSNAYFIDPTNWKVADQKLLPQISSRLLSNSEGAAQALTDIFVNDAMVKE